MSSGEAILSYLPGTVAGVWFVKSKYYQPFTGAMAKALRRVAKIISRMLMKPLRMLITAINQMLESLDRLITCRPPQSKESNAADQ